MSFVTRPFLGQYYFESHSSTGHYKKYTCFLQGLLFQDYSNSIQSFQKSWLECKQRRVCKYLAEILFWQPNQHDKFMFKNFRPPLLEKLYSHLVSSELRVWPPSLPLSQFPILACISYGHLVHGWV